MAKVKVWKRKDGGVSITHFDLSKKNDGEADEEFIERKSVRLRLQTLLEGSEEIIMDSSDLPKRDKDRDKWRLSSNKKKVEVDKSIVLPVEVLAAKKASIKGKLKAGQPLTDDEADFLVG